MAMVRSNPDKEHKIMLQWRLRDHRYSWVSSVLCILCAVGRMSTTTQRFAQANLPCFPFNSNPHVTAAYWAKIYPQTVSGMGCGGELNKSLMGWQFPLFSNCTQIQWKHSIAAACVQWLQSWATVENPMTNRCWSLLKISSPVFTEHFYTELPLCSAGLYSKQECNRNAVCITFIYHYRHHHYHDVLSV